MLLRYTGALPVTFVSLGLEAFPGDEFEVPDEDGAAFTARADVEVAPPTRMTKGKRPAATEVPPDPATTAASEGIPSGVSNDH